MIELLNVRRLLKDHLYNNTIWLIGSTFVLSGFGFFFWTIVSRFYAAQDIGLGVTIVTSMELIVSLSLLGFSVALIRYMPAEKDQATMAGSAMLLSGLIALVISAVFILGLGIFSPKLAFIRENMLFAIMFVLFTPVYTFFILIEAVFIVLRKSRMVLFKNLVYSLLKLCFPLLFVSLGAFGVYSSWTVASLLALMFAVFFLPFRFRLRIRFGVIAKMFRFGIANHAANLFSMCPNLILPLIITNMLSPEMTAYFYIVLMMAGLLYIIPNALSSPFIAESSRNPETLKANTLKAWKFVGLILGLGVLIVLFAGKYLLLIFGEQYSVNGTGLLQLVALASIPGSFNIIYSSIKNVQHKIRTVVLLNFCRALGIISLTVVLLSYGLIGIGFAWLGTESAICLFILGRFAIRGVLS